MNKTVLRAVMMCAGAPLLALGVGTATAWADANTPTDTIAALQKIDPKDVAISVGGIPLVKTGKSTAHTLGPSLAIASNNSDASTEGIGNFAIATNNSHAGAFGNLNTAIADNNSLAIASLNYLNVGTTAVAQNGSTATTATGSFTSVRSSNNSFAHANGNNNTVTATDGSNVFVNGDAATVTARCGGSVRIGTEWLEGPSNQTVTSAPCVAG